MSREAGAHHPDTDQHRLVGEVLGRRSRVCPLCIRHRHDPHRLHRGAPAKQVEQELRAMWPKCIVTVEPK